METVIVMIIGGGTIIFNKFLARYVYIYLQSPWRKLIPGRSNDAVENRLLFLLNRIGIIASGLALVALAYVMHFGVIRM